MRTQGRVKLSRPLSAMTCFVGIIFVFIGLFVVIPHIGLFGIFWTLVAAGITIYHGMNAFSDRGVAHEVVEFETPDPNPEAAPPIRQTTEQRLTALESLKQKNLITPEEYETQRRRILEDL
jgi:hypothetical protein